MDTSSPESGFDQCERNPRNRTHHRCEKNKKGEMKAEQTICKLDKNTSDVIASDRHANVGI